MCSTENPPSLVPTASPSVAGHRCHHSVESDSADKFRVDEGCPLANQGWQGRNICRNETQWIFGALVEAQKLVYSRSVPLNESCDGLGRSRMPNSLVKSSGRA